MMKIFSRLWPEKTEYKPAQLLNSEAVTDLDAIISEPIEFRLHGKIHRINPLTTEQFLKVTNEYVNIQSMQKMDSLDSQEVISRYHAFISVACASITREDIEKMTQQQAGALLNLIIGLLTGDTFKKKLQIPPVANSLQ